MRNEEGKEEVWRMGGGGGDVGSWFGHCGMGDVGGVGDLVWVERDLVGIRFFWHLQHGMGGGNRGLDITAVARRCTALDEVENRHWF